MRDVQLQKHPEISTAKASKDDRKTRQGSDLMPSLQMTRQAVLPQEALFLVHTPVEVAVSPGSPGMCTFTVPLQSPCLSVALMAVMTLTMVETPVTLFVVRPNYYQLRTKVKHGRSLPTEAQLNLDRTLHNRSSIGND